MFWRKNSYYCTNTAHCQRAMQDYVFSEAEYKAHDGHCPGTASHHCNELLTLGKSRLRHEILLVPMLAAMVVASYIGINYERIFPRMFHGVGFMAPLSEVSEQQSALSIELTRESADEEIVIQYEVKPGSATPGNDFVAQSGSLVFRRGEDRASLSIPILNDRNYQEGREVFSLELVNIVGRPVHQVIILDTPLPADQISKAEVLVKQQSLLAANLAGYAKKDQVLRKAIVNLPPNSTTRGDFLNQLAINQGNMTRARDAYITGFNALKTLDQATLTSTMDNWLSSLERQSMGQQLRATQIMKEQYLRYAESNILEMDLWLNELLGAVPESNAENPSAPFQQI